MGSHSPFKNKSSQLLLGPSSTPYRHPPILGRAVAVYYELQHPAIWPLHAYPWLKIALHLDFAECELSWFEIGTARQTLLRGPQVCFFGAKELHGINWKSEAPMIWIFVHEDYLSQLGYRSVRGVTFVQLAQLVEKDLGIFRVAELFREACRGNCTSIPLYTEAKATLLATRLLRAQFGIHEFANFTSTGINHFALRKVQDYVSSKLSIPEGRAPRLPAPATRNELSNAALARIAGLSEYHFIRQFRQRTGKTPQGYVMQCRLDKAEQLILTKHYSPKEAAYAAGFCEPGHFYRRFRLRYGKSPHNLLKQSRT